MAKKAVVKSINTNNQRCTKPKQASGACMSVPQMKNKLKSEGWVGYSRMTKKQLEIALLDPAVLGLLKRKKGFSN
jgi:hypothetical protein